MNSRFLTNIGLALAGAFLLVASQAFAAGTFEWLMLGIGVVTVLLAAAVVLSERGPAQRSLDGTVGIIGALTVIASVLTTGTALTWLGFAAGATFVALALVGLTLHELLSERVVHSIEVRHATSEPEFAGTRS